MVCRNETDTLSSLLEDGIDVVFRLPHPRDPVVIVPELVLKDTLQLCQECRLGRMLVNL